MSEIQVEFKADSPLNKAEVTKEAESHLIKRRSGDVLVEVKVISVAEMQKLNLEFMHKDRPTDVLSFPLSEIPGENQRGKRHIGTITLCSDIIKSNAKTSGKTEREEFVFVLKHGIDHLLGIHHN